MKKEVKILGLSYAQSQSGSYIVVLSEVDGKRKLPIIIKPSDAQQIAVKVEGVKQTRPSTHDILKSLTDSYSIDVQEVFIYNILEGIFYTKLIVSNGLQDMEIECTASDGMILSLVYECPLYVSDDVLDISGVYINDDGTMMDEKPEEKKPEKRVVSIDDLQHMMEDAIKNEEYEIAAEIRDRIEQLKNQDPEIE